MLHKKLLTVALITSQCLLATTSFSRNSVVLEDIDIFVETENNRLNSLSGECHFPNDKNLASTPALSAKKFESLCTQLAEMATTCLDTESGSFKTIKQLQAIASELKNFKLTSKMDTVHEKASRKILETLNEDNGKLGTCVKLTTTLPELSLLIKYQLEHLEGSEAYKAECLTPRAELTTYHSWMTMENALAAVAVSLLAVAGVLTYRYRKTHGGASRSATLAFTGTQTVAVEKKSQGMQAVTQTAEQGAQTVADAIKAVVDSAVGNSCPNTPVNPALNDSGYDDGGYDDGGYDDGGFEDRSGTPTISEDSDGPVAMSTPMQAAVAGVQNVVHGVVQGAVNGVQRLSTNARAVYDGINFITEGTTTPSGRKLRERGPNGRVIPKSPR